MPGDLADIDGLDDPTASWKNLWDVSAELLGESWGEKGISEWELKFLAEMGGDIFVDRLRFLADNAYIRNQLFFQLGSDLNLIFIFFLKDLEQLILSHFLSILNGVLQFLLKLSDGGCLSWDEIVFFLQQLSYF